MQSDEQEIKKGPNLPGTQTTPVKSNAPSAGKALAWADVLLYDRGQLFLRERMRWKR
jgi:hypothetical protein